MSLLLQATQIRDTVELEVLAEAGAIVAGAPTGEQAQSGEHTQTTFCVIVKAMVKVDVATEDREEDLVDVVEDGVELRFVAVDVVKVPEDADAVVLALVLLDTVVNVVDAVVAERIVDEIVLDELVAGEAAVVLEEELDAPGAFPTTDPTHAFQFVIPFRQVVEMVWPVCCRIVVEPRETVIVTAPVLPLKGTLPWYSPLPPDGVLLHVAVLLTPPIETIAFAADPRRAVKKILSWTTSAAWYVC